MRSGVKGDKINSFGFRVQLINFEQYKLYRAQERKEYKELSFAPVSPPDDPEWNAELLSFDDANSVPIQGLVKVIAPYEQAVETKKAKGTVKRISASIGSFGLMWGFYPYLFSLNEDTDNWKFMLSTQYLTTVKEANELTIFTAGKPGSKFSRPMRLR